MNTKASRIVFTILRILFGLSLVVFGLNAFLNFMPPPSKPMAPGAAAFAAALANTGYMMKLIGATQLIVGVLLLINHLLPLAALLFAPFIVNSICFHLFLEHSGLPMAAVFLAFEIYLIWICRDAFLAMFGCHNRPGERTGL